MGSRPHGNHEGRLPQGNGRDARLLVLNRRLKGPLYGDGRTVLDPLRLGSGQGRHGQPSSSNASSIALARTVTGTSSRTGSL